MKVNKKNKKTKTPSPNKKSSKNTKNTKKSSKKPQKPESNMNPDEMIICCKACDGNANIPSRKGMGCRG